MQALCAVVQQHLQLIKQLQQQVWGLLSTSGQAACASILLGLQQRYSRTAEAVLSTAAPISIAGQTILLQWMFLSSYVCPHRLQVCRKLTESAVHELES